MGDASTHVIFYQAYWHLVFEEDGDWVGTQDFSVICKMGAEEKIIKLEDSNV